MDINISRHSLAYILETPSLWTMRQRMTSRLCALLFDTWQQQCTAVRNC